MIEPIIFYALLLAVTILAISVGLVAFLLTRKMSNFYKLIEEEVHARQGHIESAKLLSESKLSAENIIKSAHAQAAQIINSANIMSKNQEEWFLGEIQKASQRSTESYMASLQKLLSVEEKQLSSALAASQETVLKQFKAEIDSYKLSWFKRIDASIYDVVQYVAKRIVGKSLSMEGQQEYLMKILEEGKKQNVL